MNARSACARAAVLSVLLGSPAVAATFCVNPAGAGGCQATIQAAVDLAGPGDTILVGKGVYYENVVVGSGKDGLQIVGAGPRAAILDGSAFADRGIPGGRDALFLDAPNVRVRGLGFRNGTIGVYVRWEGAILEGNEFRGTDLAVLVDNAANVQVVSNAIYDSFGGVDGSGPDLLVRGNRFERSGNSVSATNLAARNAQIVGNRLEGVSAGLVIHSNIETVLRDNVLRNSGELGVTGTNPVVEGNTLFQSSLLYAFCGGIDVDAGPNDDVPPDCTRASVSGNRVTQALSDGILVGGSTPGTMVVRDNLVARSWGGMAVGGSGDPEHPSSILVERNQVRDAGFTTSAPFFGPRGCFVVGGEGPPGEVTVRENTATECGGPGFFILARGASFETNRAVGAAGSGFYVNGLQADGLTPTDGNELHGNVAFGNAAQGIAVALGAFGTLVTDNVARGNRTDFCDEGTSTSLSGNTFGTTSSTCAIGQ